MTNPEPADQLADQTAGLLAATIVHLTDYAQLAQTLDEFAQVRGIVRNAQEENHVRRYAEALQSIEHACRLMSRRVDGSLATAKQALAELAELGIYNPQGGQQ